MSHPIKVHLDTDIGDDIDDAYCLALMLRCPELSLQSISTVFNDTSGRADLCRQMCDAVSAAPTIVAGARGVITRRPMEFAVSRDQLYTANKRHSYSTNMAGTLQALSEARRSGDALLTIGPLTNLAMSLVADPDISRFPRYIAMAGEVLTPFFSEWNIRVDPEAAAVVCSSDIKIDFIPWRIGVDTKLSLDEQAMLDRATNPVTKVLNDFRSQFRRKDQRQEMFDPMTVVALLHEEIFTWKQGRLSVELRGDATLGQTVFHADEKGPHRVAIAVDAQRAKQWMLDRLCP